MQSLTSCMVSLYNVISIAAIVLLIIITSYSFSQPSSSTRTWLDDIRCSGTESRLIDCPANTIGDENCSHYEDVALICTDTSKNI